MDDISRVGLAAIGSFIAALTVAAFVGFIRKPRLVLVAPRPFLYSLLTDKGQMVELTILNRGLRVEEDIRLDISPACKTELVAASAKDLTLVANSLKLARLPSGGEVKAALLVEGKDLTKAEVVSFSSREAQGNIVDRLEQVPMTHSQRVGMTVFIGLMLAVPFLMIQGAEMVWKHSLQVVLGETKSEEIPAKTGGWSISKSGFEILKKHTKGQAPIQLGQFSRKGDAVVIPFTVVNSSNQPLEVQMNTSSPAGDKRLGPEENKFVHGLLVFPGDTAKAVIYAYLPKSFPKQRVGLQAFVTFERLEMVQLTQILEME